MNKPPVSFLGHLSMSLPEPCRSSFPPFRKPHCPAAIKNPAIMKSPLQMLALLGVVLLSLAMPANAAETPVIGFVPRNVEIEINGVVFHGSCIEVSYDAKNASDLHYQALVLVPKTREKIPGGESMDFKMFSQITVSGVVYLVPHERLCLVNEDGTCLKIFTKKIPAEAYASDETLTAAVKAILKADKDGKQPAATPEAKPAQ